MFDIKSQDLATLIRGDDTIDELLIVQCEFGKLEEMLKNNDEVKAQCKDLEEGFDVEAYDDMDGNHVDGYYVEANNSASYALQVLYDVYSRGVGKLEELRGVYSDYLKAINPILYAEIASNIAKNKSVAQEDTDVQQQIMKDAVDIKSNTTSNSETNNHNVNTNISLKPEVTAVLTREKFVEEIYKAYNKVAQDGDKQVNFVALLSESTKINEVNAGKLYTVLSKEYKDKEIPKDKDILSIGPVWEIIDEMLSKIDWDFELLNNCRERKEFRDIIKASRMPNSTEQQL